MTAVYRTLRRAFHDPESTLYQVVQGFIAIAIVGSVLLTIVEIGGNPDNAAIFRGLDRGFLVLFTVEICLRLLTFEPPELKVIRYAPKERLKREIVGRLKYAVTPLNLLDILTLLALHPALRGLRALRVLRLARSFDFFRYSNPISNFTAAFRDNGFLYLFAFSFLISETLLGGITIFLIESSEGESATITSVADGIWWALVTLTTVGYGDFTPVTVLGRWWGAVLMVGGMFTLALFAGIIGRTLLDTVITLREEQFLMTQYADHVVLCGYEPRAEMFLRALEQEMSRDRRAVVLMGPGDRPHGVPSAFHWISGDPTKEEELTKIQLSHASMAILLGSRQVSPQQADATTILTTFTMRRFLKPHDDRRVRKLHLVTEILDDENVEHARSAGSDEVISSNRIGFSLLAHAVAQPGTANLMASVVSVGSHSVFIGRLPKSFQGSYGEASAFVKKQHGALVIGVKSTATQQEILNPPDDRPVSASDEIIYLATAPCLSET